MKRMKRVLALALAMIMVMAMALPASAADTYKITVTPSGTGVSIDGETYSAYKLFDATYADVDDETGNDVFAYSIKTDNQFYRNADAKAVLDKYFTFLDTQDATVKTVLPYGPDANANPAYYQLKNGTFTKTAPTDETKAKYVNDGTQKYAEFTTALAYKMTDELNAIEGFIAGLQADASATAASDKAEIDVTSKGAGYYLVSGTGHPYKEDGTTVDTSKTIMASLALTTTQPTATIQAKIDAPSIDKEIDKDNSKDKSSGDAKDDSVKVGDKIPYVVEGTVPAMNGFTTNYIYVVTDTMSKGLTFNNDVAIVIKDDDGDLTVPFGSKTEDPKVYFTVEYSYDDGAHWTAANAPGSALTAKTDAESTTMIRIVFHNFIDLKGQLTDQVVGDEDNSGEGVYTNPYAGDKIQISYSATVNDEAVVGTAGNDNTAKLTFSSNPNKEGTPTDDTPGPDKDEDDTTVTGETPDSKTKVYVTGLKLFKYTGADKKPLAGAKFTFEGDNLGQVKEINKTVFVPDAAGTYFLLKDGNYTEKVPTNDTTETVGDKTVTHKGTKDQYVAATGSETNKKTVDGVGDFLAFKKTTLNTYNAASATAKKYEVTTDANGIITFTGLDTGVYKLTETEAPKGYNALQAPIYIKVDYTAPNPSDGNSTCTWTVAAYSDEACTTKIADLSTSDPNAQLFLEEIENNAGTELPSTGGIGTTMFYVVGAILVIGAGVLLVSRKRMNMR